MKKIKKFSGVILMFVVAIGIFIGLVVYNRQLTDEKIAEIGEEAVKFLYDYGTVEQLDFQMSGLKQITTPEVFNQLTIDNEERTLNTYLKFKQDPVTVEVVKSTNKYVMYRLHTANISEERLFVFFFNVNKDGLIYEVREVEAIDFISNYN